MLKRILTVFLGALVIASCSLNNTSQKGLALFEAALMSDDATNNDFTRAKDYLYACVYSETKGGEAWGSPMQNVSFTYDPANSSTKIAMGFSFELPAMWVGRTYGFIVYGFKNRQPDNFICSKNPPLGVAWARLGRGFFEIKPKPEPLVIPFEDFYENVPTFIAPKVSINGGAKLTHLPQVLLTMEAEGATEVYLSNVGCDSGGDWQWFRTQQPWNLDSATNQPKVYAKFKNGAGFETECVTDSIGLDMVAPNVTLEINSGALETSTPSINLGFSANEDLSEQYITNNSDCGTGGVWEPYSSSKPWSVANTGNNTVYAKFKDLAGNISSCVSDTINYSAPTGIPTSITISLQGTLNGSPHNDFTDQANVNVVLGAIGATQVYVTNDPTCLAGGSWTAMAGSNLTLPSWTLGQTNAPNSVFAKFKNSAGESGCISDSIVHDDRVPEITTIHPSGLEPASNIAELKARFLVSELPSSVTLYVGTCSPEAVLSTTTPTLPPAYPGEVSLESTSLPQVSSQIFAQVVDPSRKTSLCVELGSFKPCLLPKCGYAGVPSCYDPDFVAAHNSACLKNGVQIDYTPAGSSIGFKVWKENGGGLRILRASGLWEGPGDWQRKLDRTGRAFSAEFLTDETLLAGRVNPSNVFLNDNNKTARGQWVYYTKDMGVQNLVKSSGTIGQDRLSNWQDPASGNGSKASWYEGNIKTCADEGMRLPTLFETQSKKPLGFLPKDADPVFGGTRVPRASNYATWTSTASTYQELCHFTWGYAASDDPTHFWVSNYAPSNKPNVRCVLPGN